MSRGFLRSANPQVEAAPAAFSFRELGAMLWLKLPQRHHPEETGPEGLASAVATIQQLCPQPNKFVLKWPHLFQLMTRVRSPAWAALSEVFTPTFLAAADVSSSVELVKRTGKNVNCKRRKMFKSNLQLPLQSGVAHFLLRCWTALWPGDSYVPGYWQSGLLSVTNFLLLKRSRSPSR